MDLEQTKKIMDQIDPPDARIVLIFVPTRAIRLIALKGDLTFRVEQLDSRVMKWRSVSTHVGDEPWESFGPAWHDGVKKQARLVEKIKLSIHENNMARIKAQNPTPETTA